MKATYLIALISVFFLNGTISCATTTVSTAAEIRSAFKNVQPGDTILVTDGSYDVGTLTISSSGKPGQLLVFKSGNRNKAVFAGDSKLVLETASYVVIDGFDFQSTVGPAIELRGCNNVRVTRNVFHLLEQTRSNWVFITGSKKNPHVLSRQNRIDRNLFENKSQLGNFITIEGSFHDGYHVSQHDTIDLNHFRDIGPRAENVLEAIRIGSSHFSLSSGHTVLEKNLFERCDGDPEYISIKSCDNIIRHNTFRECLGSLSLRHGNRNVVEGNFVLGNGRTGTFTDSTGKTWTLGTGGVRFYGDSMVIINNYFEGLTGSKWDAPLAVTNGNADYGDGQPLTKHYRIRYALIAFNTFVNNRSGIEIGYNGEGFQGNWWHRPPDGLTIANNLIVGSSDTLLKLFDQPINSTWLGNIAYPHKKAVLSRGPIDGVTVKNPRLKKQGEIWQAGKSSPVIDAAQGEFFSVTHDIEGRRRLDKKDVGALELSSGKRINRPLTGQDVGPDAK